MPRQTDTKDARPSGSTGGDARTPAPVAAAEPAAFPAWFGESEKAAARGLSPFYAAATAGGGYGVFTREGSYNALDRSAPGVDAVANAFLFASAPALLEALKQAEYWLEEHNAAGDGVPAVAMLANIRAAVALAEKGGDR